MAYDREAARAQLLKRTTEAYDRREGGISFKYFKEDNGMPLWSAKPTKDSSHILDILPFTVGNHYPLLDGRKVINKGDYTYKLDIEVHQSVGPGKMWCVCPAKNYGLPCPICEDIAALSDSGVEWDQLKGKAAKRRCAFNVLVYDGKDESKIRVWEVSHRFSDKPILLQAKSPRTGGIEVFHDPDNGKSISFEVANDEYKTIQGHKLLPREYTIPDDILDTCYVLDEEIVIMTYDQIRNIYYAGSAVAAAQDQRSDREQPAQESRRPRQPAEEPVKETPSNSCPHGHSFGNDIDRKDECGKCKAYDPCAEEADRITEKVKAERAAKRATESVGPSSESAGTVAGQRKLRRPQN